MIRQADLDAVPLTAYLSLRQLAVLDLLLLRAILGKGAFLLEALAYIESLGGPLERYPYLLGEMYHRVEEAANKPPDRIGFLILIPGDVDVFPFAEAVQNLLNEEPLGSPFFLAWIRGLDVRWNIEGDHSSFTPSPYLVDVGSTTYCYDMLGHYTTESTKLSISELQEFMAGVGYQSLMEKHDGSVCVRPADLPDPPTKKIISVSVDPDDHPVN